MPSAHTVMRVKRGRLVIMPRNTRGTLIAVTSAGEETAPVSSRTSLSLTRTLNFKLKDFLTPIYLVGRPEYSKSKVIALQWTNCIIGRIPDPNWIYLKIIIDSWSDYMGENVAYTIEFPRLAVLVLQEQQL